MSKRALFRVTVAGRDITSSLTPVLLGLQVSDKAGTHTDSAKIEIDDKNSNIVLPSIGADVSVSLGWEGEGLRPVFVGTVDEVKSSGSRSSGRRLMISAKGMNTTDRSKEPQQRHWDDTTIETILRDAADHAGIPDIKIDPSLGGIKRKYFEMRDESFIAMGERLAREVGGNFRVAGSGAILSRKVADYQTSVTASWGRNLHSWDIAPRLGRPQFGAVRARWYDMAEAAWDVVESITGLPMPSILTSRYTKPDEPEAGQQAGSEAATSQRDTGEGVVVIEGNTAAIPDGLCTVTGARPGVDGSYRIEAVTHTFSRSGGFTTAIEVKHPHGGAGVDDR